jgi:uncharacterized protein
MYIQRNITPILEKYTAFPVIALLGPRQSGKTTLSKHTFPKHTYVSFEDPDTRISAQADPRGFLRTYENAHGIIIDEFQHIPEILSYIQLEVDTKNRPGYFVLTGSQKSCVDTHHFLMNQAITQSLAGRVGIITLLTLSIQECMQSNAFDNKTIDQIIVTGTYPRICFYATYNTKNAISLLYPIIYRTRCTPTY